MTREKAIKSLQFVRNALDDSMDIATDYDIAIKALKQQPCDDAISRQAVCKIIDDIRDCISVEGYWAFLERLKKLPAINPQPKTGHWIAHPEIETSTPEYLMFYECSECGDRQCFCKSDIHKKHFCNNCGARMVEPQESEEV